MITRITLKNIASYDDTGSVIQDLSAVNFLYGTNGSGKTTISRYLHSVNCEVQSTDFADCQIESDDDCEVVVYNQDFKNKIYQTGKLPGVFTIGEDTIEHVSKIEQLKEEKQKKSDYLKKRKLTLEEKESEQKGILAEYKEAAWEILGDYQKDFQKVFTGLRGNKEKFLTELRERYRISPGGSNIIERESLVESYSSLYSTSPQTIVTISPIDFSRIREVEDNPIWRQVVIGNKDADIAGLVEHLQNADWVRSGLKFIEDDSDVCPFCQKHTIDEIFRTKLEQYFNQQFQEATDLISTLITEYQQLSNFISQKILELATNPKVNGDKISSFNTQFDAHKDKVLGIMINKKEKPSLQSEIPTGIDLFNRVSEYIIEVNQLIERNNQLASNISVERNNLINNVWVNLLSSRNAIIQQFENRLTKVQSAIEGITDSISKGQELLDQISSELEEENRKVTSTQPTIDAINRQLRSYDFDSFKIVPHPDIENHYQICRLDNTPVKNTLSEGEVTFITFLYFAQLILGGSEEDNAGNDKIVVIDDPVSSLDSSILYIVSSIIKKMRDNLLNKKGNVKQLIVLTHNVSFYRDVSFFNGRPREHQHLRYYLIRKPNSISEIQQCEKNPIDSYYGLLWNELKQENNSHIGIQNTMRRILEYYFKILGGFTDEDIIGDFPTIEEQEICRSLICWINDGSHTIPEELYVETGDTIVSKYLNVFKEIFKHSNQMAHYNMMMGIKGEE